MATSVHSSEEEDHVEASEPGEDGYWPALEILNERKHDYLVNWDGIDPETGRAWEPSWTGKAEVTEDLVEAWEAKKAAKKKNNRRVPGKRKGSRVSATPTSRPANRGSRSSRTPLLSSSRAPDSPVISLRSNNSSRVEEKPSLRKRKRRSTKHTSPDEDPNPVAKKQRVDGTSSFTSQKSRSKSIKSPQRISRETIHEEEEPLEAEDPDNTTPLPSSSKVDPGSAALRIGPPRKRKKTAPCPPATPPSSRVPVSALRKSREAEGEIHQEAAGDIPHLDPNPPTAKKKKRRLKPPSDARPKLPALAEKRSLESPLRDDAQKPEGPLNQDESLEVDPLPPDQDDKPAEPLPDHTPPRPAPQNVPPDPPLDNNFTASTPPRLVKNAKELVAIPRLEPSHFKPYLQAADSTSIIDEFSPKKLLPTQDTIESSVEGSQVRHTVMKPRHKSLDPASVHNLFDGDGIEMMQSVAGSCFDLDDQIRMLVEDQPPTDTDSVEQEPPRSQSYAGSAEAPVPVHSSSRQELQDALVLLNQKSEEIEILKSRNAALEAQIEHLQAENHRSQVENEKLSVEKEVQREALEEAKGTVSELCVHIDWVQDSWNKSMTREKQLQDEAKEVQDALDVKEEEYNLARLEWGQERALLEAQLASLKDQQPPTDWELGKQELEDKLAELSAERDQLDKDKRTAENEVESWKEQYRKEFIRSQELRREAGDAKAETTRVQRENAILASQNKEGIRLVTAKYEAVVEKLKEGLAKAGSLYKVLQEKDEQTGDDLRRRAVSATCLKEEVRRLREDLLSDQRAVHSAEHSRGEPSFLVRNPAIKLSMEDKYGCQMPIDGGTECDQTFGTPQELWAHVTGGHRRSRRQ